VRRKHPVVTRDMLHRGAARFADELGKAGLMHSMPARRIKAGCADMIQALDQTEHRDDDCGLTLP
jgi:hypothetical protein